MQAIEPYDRKRDHFARVAGIYKGLLWGLTAGVLLLSGSNLLFGGWAIYESKRGDDRVERYVVYLDDKSQPVSTARVGGAWNPTDGAFIDFASRWVRFLRARPTDIGTLEYQRGVVIKSTDRRLYNALQESMKLADEQLRSSAVDVLSISANLVERKSDDVAVIFVRWTEHVRSVAQKPATWTATLTVAYQAPEAKREFERNPLGLFAVDFNLTKETK